MTNDIFDKMKGQVVPVLTITNEADCDKKAQLLKDAKATFVEITYRNDFASKAIRYFSEKFTDIVVGAGTVIKVKQVQEAVQNGAKFIVSPGFDVDVSRECDKLGILYIPGVETASEIISAIKEGKKFLKFFPAEASGGVKKLKALSAPFPNIIFMPTGGINETNQNDYFALKCVHCVGGSYLIKDN